MAQKNRIIQGVPIKVTEIENEITLEVFDLGGNDCQQVNLQLGTRDNLKQIQNQVKSLFIL